MHYKHRKQHCFISRVLIVWHFISNKKILCRRFKLNATVFSTQRFFKRAYTICCCLIFWINPCRSAQGINVEYTAKFWRYVCFQLLLKMKLFWLMLENKFGIFKGRVFRTVTIKRGPLQAWVHKANPIKRTQSGPQANPKRT